MYAIIKTGGKQIMVEPGDEIFIEKIDVSELDEVVFDQVLAVGTEDGVRIGTPLVEGATVKGEVIKHGKGKKIVVFRYRAKHNVRVKRGHRQPHTLVQITSIEG